MTCEDASTELVECARSDRMVTRSVTNNVVAALPNNDALSTHLAVCEHCRTRWEAERELTAHLRAMRLASVPASLEWSKAVLLREFDANRKRERQVRWMWAMSTAAVLVLSVVAVRDVWMRPSARDESGSVTAVRAYAPREYPEENFLPAEEAGEKGFIRVPFALPPAPGETFGIVRRQLDQTELMRMGVSVDPAWTGTMQADVLVGEDGLAQAVRLSNDDVSEN
jgi:hypothetical protein